MNLKPPFSQLFPSFLTRWTNWQTRRRVAHLFSIWSLDIEHANFLYVEVHHFFGIAVQPPKISAETLQNSLSLFELQRLEIPHFVSAVFTQHFQKALGQYNARLDVARETITSPGHILSCVLDFVRRDFEHTLLSAVNDMAIQIVRGHLSHAAWIRKNRRQASRIDYDDISSQHPERKALRVFSFDVYAFLELKQKELMGLSLDRAQAMSWLEHFLEDLPEPPCSFPSISLNIKFQGPEFKASLRKTTEHALLSFRLLEADLVRPLEAL